MKTKLWAIGLMILCTAFTSTAQIFYKFGIEKLQLNFISIITNWSLIFGLCLYVIGAGLIIVAMKGGSVTVLYPIITTSYIWVTIGSYYIFNESISFFKILGVLTIMAGVILITYGEAHSKELEHQEAAQ